MGYTRHAKPRPVTNAASKTRIQNFLPARRATSRLTRNTPYRLPTSVDQQSQHSTAGTTRRHNYSTCTKVGKPFSPLYPAREGLWPSRFFEISIFLAGKRAYGSCSERRDSRRLELLLDNVLSFIPWGWCQPQSSVRPIVPEVLPRKPKTNIYVSLVGMCTEYMY